MSGVCDKMRRSRSRSRSRSRRRRRREQQEEALFTRESITKEDAPNAHQALHWPKNGSMSA